MRWLRLGVVVLGLTAVLLLLLIALGLFDPKPEGEFVATAVPQTLTIPPQDRQIVWLPESLPPDNFTIRTTITHQSGELDSGAGLILGDGNTAVIIAISPLGYVSVQQNKPITDYRLPITEFPWQPWPHVRPGNAANEIWVDVVEGRMQVRMNRELLWAGDVLIQPTTAGLYGESFGGTAVFHFSGLVLSHDKAVTLPTQTAD